MEKLIIKSIRANNITSLKQMLSLKIYDYDFFDFSFKVTITQIESAVGGRCGEGALSDSVFL